MKRLLTYAGALAVGAGLAFAVAGSSHAAPAQSLLPGLAGTEPAVTQVDCRRYRHCHRYCSKRTILGICLKHRTYCHRCR